MKTENIKNRRGLEKCHPERFDEKNPWEGETSEKLKDYSEFLTSALLANDKNFVLNINGTWGSGKTFFISRWAQDLKNRNHTVINYNAWECDSCSDPFASLVAAFISQIPDTFGEEKTKVREKAGNFLKSTPFLIAHGLAEFFSLSDTLNKLKKNLEYADTGSTILPFDQIDGALERIEAVWAFKSALESLAESQKQSGPIFIFVDELDRCRPSFAIELLERIKHLFDAKSVKFIIASDTLQLAASIKAVYGSEFNSKTYLHRFFDQTFNLPQMDYISFAKKLFKDYGFCERNSKGLEFKASHAYKEDLECLGEQNNWTPLDYFMFLSHKFNLSLREQEICFKRAILISEHIELYEIISPRGVIYKYDYIALDLLFLGIILNLKDETLYKQLFYSTINTISVADQAVSVIPNEAWKKINENLNSYNSNVYKGIDCMNGYFGFKRDLGVDHFGKRRSDRDRVFKMVRMPEKYKDFIELTALVGDTETVL